MSTRETLLLDYQRADHMFPGGIYQDPYSVKPQQAHFAALQLQKEKEKKYQKVKPNNNKNQLICTDKSNLLQLAQAPCK